MRELKKRDPEKYARLFASYENMAAGGDAHGTRFLKGYRGVPDEDYRSLVETLTRDAEKEKRGLLGAMRTFFGRK